jgi:hypothetical protein
MKMSELILAIGDENVIFQNLDRDAETIDKTKRGMKVVFYTGAIDEADLLSMIGGEKSKKIGLVLWLPRDKVEAAIAAEKLQSAAPSQAAAVPAIPKP